MPDQPRTDCCDRMVDELSHACDQHGSAFDCPDRLIVYVAKFDEYGLIVHDGGESMVAIAFCPWCGIKLPDSKRDRWFAELEGRGFADPVADDIPIEYRSDAWHRQSART